MSKRIVGEALLLGVIVCCVCWGQERTQAPTAALPQLLSVAAADDDSKGRVKPKATPERGRRKKQRELKKPAVEHLTAAEDAASERAIRSQAAALIADFNAKNTEAFVERFLPKAEYELETGDVISGRPAIRRHFAQCFAQFPDARARTRASKIRLISRHMAIDEGTYSISHSTGDPESANNYVAIWTHSDGQWLLASVRELSGEHSATQSHKHLESLKWLVGAWLDESPDALVKTSCRWSEDGNFLLQDFVVKVAGTDVLSGTNRIGWDPLTQKVRAWLFDSAGGFGESFWNWDGERWVIRSSAVRADGVIVASLNYLIPVEDDVYRWEASHRMAGDEPLPDVSVLIVRQAPPPESTAANESDQ